MKPLNVVVTADREVPPIVTDGLIMNLDAGNSASWTGSGAWQDLTANNYDWTRNGPTFNGVVGGLSSSEYFSFDDTNDYFVQSAAWSGSVPRNLGRSDIAFTVDVWCWPNVGAAGTVDSIFGNTASAGDKSCDIYMFNSNNTVRFGGYVGSASYPEKTSTGKLIEGQWNHFSLAAHPDATPEGTFYFNTANGGSAAVDRTGWSSGDSTNLMNIGRELSASSYWGGRMAIIRIYDRVLTHNEVRQNFFALRGRFGI